MKRIVVLVPGLFSAPEAEPTIYKNAPHLAELAARGDVSRLSFEPTSLPEAQFLGLSPDSISIHEGPLTVAALKSEPPSHAMQYRLSVLSVKDGIVSAPVFRIPAKTHAEIFTLAKRLETRKLTLLPGWDQVNAMALEHASPYERTTDPSAAHQKALAEVWPEGENERELRMFIDDSINLLSEQEFNRIREEEGLPTLNVLWPWGGGFTGKMPNLVLERGMCPRIITSSTRLLGLSWLVRWKPVNAQDWGSGTAIQWEKFAEESLASDVCVILWNEWQHFRAENKMEEAIWLAREFDSRFIAPLTQELSIQDVKLSIAGSGCFGNDWLGLRVGKSSITGTFPFDERLADDNRLLRQGFSQWVRDGMEIE